jgi:hypothetical protein
MVTAVATVVIWAAALLLRLIAGAGSDLIDFALVFAFGSTAALWLAWAFQSLDALNKASQQGKAKREAPEDDTRLALLLQMLDEDEREALKQRLRDELSADGEAIALGDLLDDRPARRAAE